MIPPNRRYPFDAYGPNLRLVEGLKQLWDCREETLDEGKEIVRRLYDNADHWAHSVVHAECED